MTNTYNVPTKEKLLAFAEEISSEYDEIMHSEIYQYDPPISEVLLTLVEGRELDDSVREELSELYADWEASGYPLPPEDLEEVTEGGPPQKPNSP